MKAALGRRSRLPDVQAYSRLAEHSRRPRDARLVLKQAQKLSGVVHTRLIELDHVNTERLQLMSLLVERSLKRKGEILAPAIVLVCNGVDDRHWARQCELELRAAWARGLGFGSTAR